MPAARRITLVASVVALVVAVTAIVHGNDASARAAATQHSVTVRGVEWRSLDFRASAQYVPNTGGGISVQVGNSTPPHPYFEAAMRVPAGALINQVTFYLQDCGTQIVGHPGALADWYFAAYNPTKATGHFILPVARTPASMWDCDLHSWVRTVSPPVKVLATTSYVAGVDPHSVTSGNEPPADPKLIIEGAKVRYTCPNGC